MIDDYLLYPCTGKSITIKALTIGVTGATGKDLLPQLLADDTYAEVHCFARKPLALTYPKLHAHVADFDIPRAWTDLLHGDVASSCLGVTLAMADSKGAQWRAGYDYQYALVEHCENNGVPTLVLVSAIGVKAQSKLFHNRMKEALGGTVKKLNFPRLLIFQPSIFIHSNSDREGEDSTVKATSSLNKLGLLRHYRPTFTTVLAARMQHEVGMAAKGIHTFTFDKIFF